VADLVKNFGVKIYGVQANSRFEAKPFYEELAELSGGVYLTLQHLRLITDMFLAVCYREFGAEVRLSWFFNIVLLFYYFIIFIYFPNCTIFSTWKPSEQKSLKEVGWTKA
jgi:hypothetical protein